MSRLSLVFFTCLLVALLAGCSDDPVVKLDGKVDGPGGGMDGGTDTMSQGDGLTSDGQLPDQGTPDGGSAAALQAVVNNLTLPKNGGQFAVDLDNNKTQDNQLGNIMGVLNTILTGSMDAQTQLDEQIKQGAILLLFDVLSKSIVNDPKMNLGFFLGHDFDSDPLDNFSGNEQFGISSSSPTNIKLPGAITNSKLLAGPGSLIVPIPMGGVTPVNMALSKGQVMATLSTSGMASGQINGAIPMTDVDNNLLPALANLLDTLYKDPTTDAATKLLLKTMFDTKPPIGTITVADIKGNLLIGMLIKADVDVDPKVPGFDAMSVGMGFTGVPCTIKKN